MAHAIPYGARSTADQVLAGIDLTRKRIVVTGCSSGIGFETMNALVANGAHVIGLARTHDSARAACKSAGASATPIACDMADLESVEAAADSILRLPGPLDAVIANADAGLTGRLWEASERIVSSIRSPAFSARAIQCGPPGRRPVDS